ncbi:MAG: histidinol dehydrogenase [Phycisphaerales bacterium]|nr:histidinol dehydrogenase [Phycisphaerales bacterium]
MNQDTETLLRIISAEDFDPQSTPNSSDRVLTEAQEIVDRVRDQGISAIRAYAIRFGELDESAPMVLGRDAMRSAYEALQQEDREALERAGERIERFARAQRDAIQTMTMDVPGGQAGHTVEPVRVAGCYAPAGRYPLPSSVLMTAITARAAGCERVVVSSPGAQQVALAASYIAGADEFLCVGGAHAIAAMAYGFEGFERCDVIVGPGNGWVTAAKRIVSGDVGIDMLAGPSELLVLADESADLNLIAADLLAQAEHDSDAIPLLVTTCDAHAQQIQATIEDQLASLPTADTAREALKNGFVIVCGSLEVAIEITDQLAPEHLEIMMADSERVAARIRNAGALFIGSKSAEVIGDYGIGPNHTLPTGQTARFQAGLSVVHFLRLRTWIRIDDPTACAPVLEDTQRIARMEGLIGHERSAARRALGTQ